MNEPHPQPIVRMKGIVKRFPGVVALDHVDFELRPGEVHMLLGENGAGKSTLIKVLSGACTCDEGEIFVSGERMHITSPQIPLERGLRFIYQEISLVQELDIARNMFLGMEPLKVRALGIVDQKALYEGAESCLDRFGIGLDPRTIVRNLSVTQQKMVEIARALVTDARVIVLDEPTDVLEDQSRHLLFDVIRRLKNAHGVGFIYISHRYAEVHELGDRVTILRDGVNTRTHLVREISLPEILEEMIGRPVGRTYPRLPEPAADVALAVEDVRRAPVLNGVSLSVRKGEIVGVTGLMGAGKTELARAIAGADRRDTGRICIEGRTVRIEHPGDSIAAGIGLLTEDRKDEGLIQDHSIRDNYAIPSLSRLGRFGLLKHRQVDREVARHLDRLSIKATGIRHIAGQLSGGNQQKAVLAKWLGARCRVLLFDEPTRGIDISGRSAIYEIMTELLEQGVGILMFTSDYTEALEMSHRVIVLRHGQICAELKRGETTEQEILRYAVGVEAEDSCSESRSEDLA